MASHAETILNEIKYPRLTLNSTTYLLQLKLYIENGEDVILQDLMSGLWKSLEWKAERPQ